MSASKTAGALLASNLVYLQNDALLEVRNRLRDVVEAGDAEAVHHEFVAIQHLVDTVACATESMMEYIGSNASWEAVPSGRITRRAPCPDGACEPDPDNSFRLPRYDNGGWYTVSIPRCRKCELGMANFTPQETSP
jgi:hypothetical protein